MKKSFLLDRFLTVDYMEQLVVRNGFSLVNKPPKDLKKTLLYYKNKLDSGNEAPYIVNEDEMVMAEIPLNNAEYYQIKWNIPKLLYLIEREQIQKTALPEDLAEKLSRKSDIEKFPADAENKDIILLSYPPISRKFIIAQGDTKKLAESPKTITAYILPPYIHLKAAAHSLDRNLFSIHFNYSLICSYLAGQITLEEAEKRVFPVF